MKTEINTTDCYSLWADYIKNRLYYTHSKEIWRGEEIIEQFRLDWIKAVDSMQKNFTVLADLRRMGAMSNKFQKVMEELQRYQLENGFLYSASIISENDIALLQVHRTVKNTQLPVQHFKTKEQAENFLDAVVEKLKNQVEK